MEQFAPYGHALVSVALYAVVANILNAATGISKGGLNLAPGALPEADYANKAWRLDRTYMNTVEMLSFYAAVVFAAILARADATWVNWLASIGFLTRLGVCAVYLPGIGKGYGGIRTGFNIIGSVCNIGLVLLTIFAVV